MRSTAPLAKLYVSDLNVRKTDRDLDIEQLADNIAAHGLIEPLVVVDEGKGKGRLGVIAGGRRFLALQLLDGANDWPADKIDRKAIPVTVRGIEEAREISLSENVHSVRMNPVDEFEAYAAIIADYEAAGETDPAARILRCARHFGQTERYVEQRLRLAALAPDILEALRRGAIGLDAARAYAQVGDEALQMQVFAAQDRQRQHSAAGIRAALAGRIYRTGDRQVRYVGLDSYVAAGGRLDRDLFMGAEDGEVVLDTVLLDRLCTEKGEAEATRVAIEAGYAGAVLGSWGGASWQWPKSPAGFDRVYSLAALAPEDRARALVVCRIAEDGSRVEPTGEGFRPCTRPAAASAFAGLTPSEATAAAATRSVPSFLPIGIGVAAARHRGESELEQLARIRRRDIELTAIRLAFPRLEGTPLEGATFWPPRDQSLVPAVQAEDEDHYAVAVYVKVPKSEVARLMDRAEAEVDGTPLPPRRPDEAEDWPEDPAPPPAAATPARVQSEPAPAEPAPELTALQLAELIEERFATAAFAEGYEGVRAAERFALDLIAELKRDHGARHRSTSGGEALTLAGLSYSCTAGRCAVLKAWARKARAAATPARVLEETEA